jgi:hypothetical protein
MRIYDILKKSKAVASYEDEAFPIYSLENETSDYESVFPSEPYVEVKVKDLPDEVYDAFREMAQFKEIEMPSSNDIVLRYEVFTESNEFIDWYVTEDC